MTHAEPSSGRKVIQFFAGALAGAIAAILILAGVLTLISPFYLGEQSLSILAFAILGFIPALVVGGALGALFVRLARGTSNPRRTATIGIALYLFAIVTGFIGVPLLVPYMENAARERTNVQVREHVDQAFETEQASWKSVYVDRYPYTEASLPRLLGPIQYPNARLVSWEDTPGPVPGWVIHTITDDPPDQVLEFYASVLPRGIEGYPSGFLIDRTYGWSTYSALLPSIDRAEARVTLESEPDAIRIRYTVHSPIMIGSEPSQPWTQEQSESFLGDARIKRRELINTIASESAQWLYPGATYTWGDLASKKQLAYETTDSLTQVIAHYESLKGESREFKGQYRFKPNHDIGWNPELTVYEVGDKVRIHFRYLQ